MININAKLRLRTSKQKTNCKLFRSPITIYTRFSVASHIPAAVVTPTHSARGATWARKPSTIRVLDRFASYSTIQDSAFRIVSTVNPMHFRPMLLQLAATCHPRSGDSFWSPRHACGNALQLHLGVSSE